MSRRFAIAVALIAAAVFAVVYFWPKHAAADPEIPVTARLHLGDAAVGLEARFGKRPGRHDGGGGWRRRDGHHGHGHRRGHGRRSLLVVPYAEPFERVIVHETVIAPPPAPVAEMPAQPPETLDPRGRARTLSARGAEPPREWVLGDVLPADMPHVALDPDSYGLPQPPDGQIYARVDGDVLRIDADTRRIVAVVAR